MQGSSCKRGLSGPLYRVFEARIAVDDLFSCQFCLFELGRRRIFHRPRGRQGGLVAWGLCGADSPGRRPFETGGGHRK